MGIINIIKVWIDGSGAPKSALVDGSGHPQVDVLSMPALIPKHDERVYGYTSGDLTSITYKLDTVTVATITLSYTSGDLTGWSIATP